jgi:hypothetical protein
MKHSIFCKTIFYKGSPIAMFGIVPHDILGDAATVWMLGTDDIKKIKRYDIEKSNLF